MIPLRIRFEKLGRARYISHLDLNRCMQRALKRADIPIWYTQGFNPHPYITFALPLSLFYGSECEIMDLRLDGEMSLETVKESLEANMPEGITILDVSEPRLKITEMGYAAYSIELDYNGVSHDEIASAVDKIKSLEKVNIDKVTKRHTIELDIKEYIDSAEYNIEDGKLTINLVLPASPEENLNPSIITTAFSKYLDHKPNFEQVTRLCIYNKEMQIFA